MELTPSRLDANTAARGGSASLLDRIVDALARDSRAWFGEEIARTFLKLTSNGANTDSLVRALLANDPRFTESPRGSWTARRQAERPLLSERVWLAWSPPAEPGRSWRLHLRPWPGARRADDRVLRAELPGEWLSLCEGELDPRFVSLQPGAVARVVASLERSGSFGEPQVIDLGVWIKLVLLSDGVLPESLSSQARLPEVFRRWNLGPLREGADGALDALAALVDALSERSPGWTLHEIERRRRGTLETRAVDWSRFAFTRMEIEALPATAGVYRFHDASGALLYVGKARCLAQRVASYFRPLPPEPTKREELLREIRTVEIEPLPSELDALIEEAAQIRGHQPKWNVQVDVHQQERELPVSEWPLLFVAPGQDPLRATVLVLPGPDAGYRLRLPRDPDPSSFEALATWLDALLKGASVSLTGLTQARVPGLALDRDGLALTLRYYARFRDDLDRCDALDLADGRMAAERLSQLCRATGGGAGATLQR